MSKVDMHMDICGKLNLIYTKKNADYGDSVTNTYNKYGLISYIVRMEDKLNRLATLDKQGGIGEVSDEKLEDTLMDLANYAIMTIMEIKKDQEGRTSEAVQD